MREYFDEQLHGLNLEIIKMGGVVEQAIEKSITALKERDFALAEKIMEQDNIIDDFERDIEKKCMNMLLRYQPVARDLRAIGTALKIITDMERIGDHATDISEITLLMSGEEYVKNLDIIPKMAEEAIYMLKQAIDAYVKLDVVLAQKVIDYDDVVDRLFDNIKHELVSHMVVSRQHVDQLVNFLLIAKYIERIGDHATNIAEWVIFDVTGSHGE